MKLRKGRDRGAKIRAFGGKSITEVGPTLNCPRANRSSASVLFAIESRAIHPSCNSFISGSNRAVRRRLAGMNFGHVSRRDVPPLRLSRFPRGSGRGARYGVTMKFPPPPRGTLQVEARPCEAKPMKNDRFRFDSDRAAGETDGFARNPFSRFFARLLYVCPRFSVNTRGLINSRPTCTTVHP